MFLAMDAHEARAALLFESYAVVAKIEATAGEGRVDRRAREIARHAVHGRAEPRRIFRGVAALARLRAGVVRAQHVAALERTRTCARRDHRSRLPATGTERTRDQDRSAN